MEKLGCSLPALLMLLWTFCSATITKLENRREYQASPSELTPEVAYQMVKGLQKCPTDPKPVDCEEVMKNGNAANGIYTIWPRSRVLKCETLKVYCDMKTDGGGWTVIQRRGDFNNPVDYFNKEWIEYKTGFGKLRKEFWIGNDNIFAITNQGSYAVRFDMRQRNGSTGFAQYESFWIEDEGQNYRLHLLDFSGGNAGDAMSPHHLREFYTKDRPNIPDDITKEGPRHQAGWWFNIFPSSNLNGLNKRSNFETRDGIQWNPFGGYVNSMESAEIKVRSKNF